METPLWINITFILVLFPGAVKCFAQSSGNSNLTDSKGEYLLHPSVITSEPKFEVRFKVNPNLSKNNSARQVHKVGPIFKPGTLLVGDSIEFQIFSNKVEALEGDVSCKNTYEQIAGVSKLKQNETTAEFRVEARRLGREYIICSAEPKLSSESSEIEVPVVVLRRRGFLDDFLPKYVMVMAVVLNTVFGTEVSLKDLRFIVTCRPKPLLAAAWGLAIVRLFQYEPDISLGVLMVACAPGGGNSNTATYLVDGEVSLSISMTFFSTALSLGLMPLNLWIYGRFVSENPKYSPEDIPYLKLVSTLAFIVVPVVVGMTLLHAFPRTTQKVTRHAKPCVLLVILVFIGMAISRSIYTFDLITYRAVLGAFSLPLGGFTLGTITSVFARLRLSQVKTIAVEVGMQNAGIVVGMGFLAFRPPEADLNTLMPIYISLITAFVAVPLYAGHFVALRCCKSYREICQKNKEELIRERTFFDGAQTSNRKRFVERGLEMVES